MSKRKVEDILIRRDGISRQEARELIAECIDEIGRGNEYATEEVLGLEPDYIFDILW